MFFTIYMKIQFLGTSGYGITQSRDLPSIIIDKNILFDCGEGCMRNLLKYNYSIENIKAIFISHMHPDHILGIFSILFKLAFYSENNVSIQSTGKKYSPKIYVPSGEKKKLEDMIQITSSTFENVNFFVDIIELEMKEDNNSVDIKIDDLIYSIKWIPSNHVPKCYSYKINDKIFYSSDTRPNNLFQEFAHSCTVIIHEATFFDEKKTLAHQLNHSTPSDAAKLASQTLAKDLILFHVPDLSQNSEKIFLKQAQKIFGNIKVAKDGESFLVN